MTPEERRQWARRFRDEEVRPIVARLFRNFEATYGRGLTPEELGDYQLATDLMGEMAEGLIRLKRK